MRQRLVLIAVAALAVLTAPTAANATTITANDATFSSGPYIVLDTPMGCC